MILTLLMVGQGHSYGQTEPNSNTAEDSSIGSADVPFSSKFLLTGGLRQIEGSAGGVLTPWAVIGGYGTDGQIGGNAFYTRVQSDDYHMDTGGVLIGIYDRLEISLARQEFNTEAVGAALGLGGGFEFKQNIIGAKLKLIGDVELDQDRWLPQISVGVQHKRNNQEDVLGAIGARDDNGTDFYLTGTKLFLAQSLLLNGTLRLTKANQLGILGFGGDKNNSYEPQFEGSVAYLLTRDIAIGGEYRTKPNNLGIAQEDDWWDIFVAWAPTKNIAVTAAYADLGNIVIEDDQRAAYLSIQVGF